MKCKDCKFAKPSGFYCEDAKLFVDKTGSCNKGEKRQDGWDIIGEILEEIVVRIYESREQSNFCRREHKTPERYQGEWQDGLYYYQGKSMAYAGIADMIKYKLSRSDIKVKISLYRDCDDRDLGGE